MNKKTKNTWTIVVVGFLIVFALFSPWIYFAAPIEGWVVDSKTGKPIRGVIVVAHWELNIGTPAGRIPGGQLEVLETITDKNGRYYFSGWGPKIAIISYLDEKDPNLIYFKSGYKYDIYWNNENAGRNRSVIRRSQWNGKKIQLEKFSGTTQKYAEHLHKLDREIEFARYGDGCHWKEIPKLLTEIDRYANRFEAEKIKIEGWQGGARIRNKTDVKSSSGCGDPNKYFQGLG